MHRHRFEFSSNWPNDLVCKHTCRDSKESCTMLAEDETHAIRGSRLIPRGYYTPEMFSNRIPQLLQRNPARVSADPGLDDREHYLGASLALTPGVLSDFTIIIDEPDVGFDIRCDGGDQQLVIFSGTHGTGLDALFDAARAHWVRYHSHLSH